MERARMKKFVRGILIVLAVDYLALVAGLFWVMHDPARFGQTMRHIPEPAMYAVPYFKYLWFVARAGRLKVGDAAPDFHLLASDKTTQIQLASFRGQKPVVLIFGSYT